MQPPFERKDLDQIEVLFEDALREVLNEKPEPGVRTRALRLRTAGVALLILASACISFVALLSRTTLAMGTLILAGVAIALLFLGGWLIDKAGAHELGTRRCASEGSLRDDLRDTDSVPVAPRIRRKRHFGIGMLALAAFCVCVGAAPWPGKQFQDAVMWAGFSITLLVVGAWHIIKAARDVIRAREMSAAAQRRESANARGHLRRAE